MDEVDYSSSDSSTWKIHCSVLATGETVKGVAFRGWAEPGSGRLQSRHLPGYDCQHSAFLSAAGPCSSVGWRAVGATTAHGPRTTPKPSIASNRHPHFDSAYDPCSNRSWVWVACRSGRASSWGLESCSVAHSARESHPLRRRIHPEIAALPSSRPQA